jgi:hypothetical protein
MLTEDRVHEPGTGPGQVASLVQAERWLFAALITGAGLVFCLCLWLVPKGDWVSVKHSSLWQPADTPPYRTAPAYSVEFMIEYTGFRGFRARSGRAELRVQFDDRRRESTVFDAADQSVLSSTVQGIQPGDRFGVATVEAAYGSAGLDLTDAQVRKEADQVAEWLSAILANPSVAGMQSDARGLARRDGGTTSQGETAFRVGLLPASIQLTFAVMIGAGIVAYGLTVPWLHRRYRAARDLSQGQADGDL